jgi:hypothetical protein
MRILREQGFGVAFNDLVGNVGHSKSHRSILICIIERKHAFT